MYTHDHGSFDPGHILLDALTDTAWMLPFLFLAYLAIETIERRQGARVERLLARGGRFGFAVGAVLGVVPQCGFSTMAAGFYASRVITLGTLLAVFLSTSDEAIPLMLAQPNSWPALALLIGCKLVWALVVGLLVDILLRRAIPQGLRGGYGGGAAVDCHHHEEQDGILLAAAKHTANIVLIIFGFTFAFGLLVGLVGEARVEQFLLALGPFQPLVAGLFGLIPNCASSVLLTQLYLEGSISFGSVLAGLNCNAGIGLLVLFRTNRSLRQNLFILGLLVAAGVLPGLALHLFGV
ncbi:arsenic efflux protein [Ruminococcaceae bacterium OttesenSCG-928-D13]|nr:arsenic efflux protein [Ruminococcaceae bacterium OttesenSCG-928-D13]